MKFLRHAWLPILLLSLCSCTCLRAQELTFLGGLLPKASLERSSYTWQIDYRQDLSSYFALSTAYINEGHTPGHHRDGTAWQAWGRMPLFKDRISVSLGLGAYYFYDTQPLPGGDTANIHGTAPIYSLSATGYLSNRWYYRVNYNRIDPTGQIKVSTVSVGAGFWFGRDRKPTSGKLGDALEQQGYISDNELTVFAGQSVVNTFLNPMSRAFAGEYRKGVFPHVDWTASAIYEGSSQIVRRSGAASQFWFVNSFFKDRVTFGAGLGPYLYIDRNHPSNVGRTNPAAFAPLASLTVSVRLSDQWITRLVFNRVTSNYNRDADIFLIGLGYRWPR